MKPNNSSKEWMQYAGLASQWLVMIALALYLGIQADKKIGPRSRLCSILFPLIAITVSLYRIVKKTNPKQ